MYQFSKLNWYMQKSMQNRLRRWDFCTPESFSHGLRSKCADLGELLREPAILREMMHILGEIGNIVHERVFTVKREDFVYGKEKQ